MIRYTLLAEGILEDVFIPGLLSRMTSKELCRSPLSIKKSASPSKSKVIKHLTDFAKTSLGEKNENFFIVGIDLDEPDHEQKKTKRIEKELLSKIPKNIDVNKVVVFIPIQAFDHWLLYQDYKTKKGQRTSDHSLDAKDSKTVKKLLYGESNPNQNKIRKTADRILSVIDLEDLRKQSKSFDHFYNQIKRHL